MNNVLKPTTAITGKSRLLARLALTCLAAACLPAIALAQAAKSGGTNPAEVFQRMSGDKWVSREITFAQLGFTGPLVLGAPDTRREIYLPVPANVALADGEIRLNANYMRADGGRTSLTLSVDTYPVSSRPFALEKGDAGIAFAVDGTPRSNGFVRLGINWNTALGADELCADARAAGNLLRIEPTSRFTYRYDGSSIRDLTTAWGALPATTVILVSANSLSSESYDSAWRMGVALERAGKRSRIIALPAVGDTIDLEGVNIPSGLRSIPAFAALAQGGSYRLKDAAEVGALLALGQGGPFRADIVIADKAMSSNMSAAFDALRAQLQASAPDAVAPFTEWRARALDPSAQQMVSKQIQLANAFGQPSIIIAADAGAKAAGLFSAYWNRVAIASVMQVEAAADPAGDGSAISLKYLGGKPGSFDVLAHADWNAVFDIGAVSADGRIPGQLILDIAAAPSAARTPPVASVFMNDILIGAKQMEANGKPERISAKVPRYSLAAHNTLRVAFVRQLASDRCRETPEAYPVSVLPSSHLILEKATPSPDFTGTIALYASGVHVMVPAAYLASATSTLPSVVRLAATTGVSPLNARFTAITGDTIPPPGGPFLALELPFKDAGSKISLNGGKMVMAGVNDKVILDVTGLDRVGIVEVIKVGGVSGVSYRSVGKLPPSMEKPILLSQGDVAVIGSAGLLSEVNSADPGGRNVIHSDDSPWLLARGYWWMLPILAIAFMIALLVFASRMRRRKAASNSKT